MNLLMATFSGLLGASWRGAALILLVLALRRLFRAYMPGGVWFAAWLVATVPLLTPFPVPTQWSPFNLLRLPVPAVARPRAVSTVRLTPTANVARETSEASSDSPHAIAPP